MLIAIAIMTILITINTFFTFAILSNVSNECNKIKKLLRALLAKQYGIDVYEDDVKKFQKNKKGVLAIC